MIAPVRRTALSVPRMFGQVRFNSGPVGNASGATADSASFKNREQGEESVYIKQHEAEQLKAYKEKIQAHKKEIEKLEGEIKDLEK